MTHRWNGDPVRPDLNNMLRTCGKCGLVQITRHEPENRPQHWVEFHRDGKRVDVDGKTPVCERVMVPA
jgi:hypothetical protein